MSKKYILSILLVAFLTGCVPAEMGIFVPRDDRAVRFGAATQYDNDISTKTVYSGAYYLNGSASALSAAQVERIDWLSTDRITVYSPQALQYDKVASPWTLTRKGQVHGVDYAFVSYGISPGDIDAEKHKASATISDSTDGLQWADKSTAHKFYAVYPSADLANGKDKPVVSLDAIDGNGVATYTVSGSNSTAGMRGIPIEQGGIEDGSGNWTQWGEWVEAQTGEHKRLEYKPNMNFAAMAAYATGTYGTSVSLSFKPLVTALRVELLAHANDPVYENELKEVILRSKNRTLTGDYRFSIGGDSPGGTPGSFSIFERAGDHIIINLSQQHTKLSTVDTTVVTFLCAPVPQTELSLELVFSNGETRTLELKDTNKDWITLSACKKSYLNRIPVHKEYEFSVTLNREEAGARNVVFPSSGGTYDDMMSVVSYARDGSETPMPWSIAGYSVNGVYTSGTVGLDAWFSTITQAGDGGKTEAKFTVGMTNNSHSTLISSDWSLVGGADEENARDLSYYDIKGVSRGTRITANCYTVQGKGWYKFPLVYGNAINFVKALDGNNEAAYRGSGTGNFLTSFVNHENAPITAPWITAGPSDQSLGGMNYPVKSAKVVWQDSDNLIHNTKIGVSGNDQNYLYFYLGDDIKEGNAVVAAALEDGTVVWSWHIWVVHMESAGRDFNTQVVEPIPDDPVIDPQKGAAGTPGMHTYKAPYWRYTFKFYNRSKIYNRMLNINLGYTPGPQGTSEPRAIVVRFVQGSSGLHQDVTFAQRGDMSGGSCVYYQWGRKDPLFPSRYDFDNKEMRNARLYDGDGFLILDGTQPAQKEAVPAAFVRTNGTISQTIQNPGIYYSAGQQVYYNLWNTRVNDVSQIGDQNDDGYSRGSDLAVEKTVYDPCPPGFKVPNEFAYSGFNSTGGDIVLTKSDGTYSEGHFEGVTLNTIVDDLVNVRNAKYDVDRGYRFRVIPHKQNADQILFRAFGHRNPDGSLWDYPTTAYKSGAGYYWTSAPRLNTVSGTLYGGSFVFSFNRVRSVVGSPRESYTESGAGIRWPTGIDQGFPEGFTPANAFTIRPVED